MFTGHRKSQAAFEFLVTYGWAIMAVLIALGALVYFGFTGTSNILPDKCIFSSSLQCVDYYATTNSINYTIRNSLSNSIYNVTATISNIGGVGVTSCSINGLNSVGIMTPGDVAKIYCSGFSSGQNFAVGQRVKFKMQVNYRKIPNGYTHIAMGELYTTIQ